MWQRPVIVISVLAVTIGACTTARSAPATAPPTSAARTTTTASTTTTTAPDTTTSEATTTTVDRVAEITAIFEDLERRRLEAIAAGDREAFQSLYSSPEYLQQDIAALDLVTVLDPGAVSLGNVIVRVDSSSCLAFDVTIDNTRALAVGTAGRATVVLEKLGDQWGYSWIGSGWECDGPHPLSS